ncbi:MAG: hypothetical protein AB1540_04155 [Bdellovibrionota bacterium]
MRTSKVFMITTGILLASAVAIGNGAVAPELPILAQAKSSSEYPLLKRIQDLTLDLQLLEITIKNKRSPETETKIAAALQKNENEGQKLGEKFKALREEQLEQIFSLFMLARRYQEYAQVEDHVWKELFSALRDGQLTAGTLTVPSKSGVLNVLSLVPLEMGKQVLWSISLPQWDKRSYWSQVKRKLPKSNAHSQPIHPIALGERIQKANQAYAVAEQAARAYFVSCYAELYNAFKDHRYAILQRVTLARKALVELSQSNTTMSVPEQYATLYNRVLENLFSYGVNISLGTAQRDYSLKGFLFAETPEAAQTLLNKLKFTPSDVSYNSPSS